MPQQDLVRVTPEEIVNFILEEMEAGLCPTYYSNLVPSVYDVYLYSDDLERLRPLEQRMREEAVNALSEKLSALNKAAQPKLKIPLGAPKKRKKRYETLGEWSVEFHENADEDARENPLVIHSTFPAASDSEDRAGTLTERITKRRTDGQTVTTSTQRTGDVDTSRATGIVYANLAYEDDSGAHTFQMTKDLVKIGRGSPDHWVDLKLKAKKDVSREHLQVRRDPSTGKLFLKDLSTLGTTVDGKRVPPSIQQVDGADVDANIEVPLPGKARIGLAGVLFIDFKAVKQK
ncbi:MAG TPA: FhaA domain-containing protein [Bryobacteraceae bacterium]|jgi:pSer/pThr/pTyr-binding forkhead associated (FHA) protein|nr:FhaA domain-containing protein [Bryobacteraceae bacterium]